MKKTPLVSVICLCYNHADYVIESLTSVFEQTYKHIELIIVDDASTDESAVIIEKFLADHLQVRFINQAANVGNCISFNNALKYAKGRYIIDLAADDILLPDRISEGVKAFEQSSNEYGVNFTDASYIDKQGKLMKGHYLRDDAGVVITNIPEGNVFKEVLKSYFICSPTAMIKKVVLEELGGYDESLAYEDFDLWVRASRNWKFCYTNMVLVQKRVLTHSHGQQQYKRGNSQMRSTYQVCLKAYHLCQSNDDFLALRTRIRYELKHSIWLMKMPLVIKYLNLWIKSIR